MKAETRKLVREALSMLMDWIHGHEEREFYPGATMAKAEIALRALAAEDADSEGDRLAEAIEGVLNSVLAKRLEDDKWENGLGMLGLGSGKTYLAERLRALRAAHAKRGGGG